MLLAGCGQIQLTTSPVACEYGDQSYPAGAGGIVAADGQNTCFCDSSGQIACTELAYADSETGSTLTSPAAVRCSVDGYIFELREGVGYCSDPATETECPAWDYLRGDNSSGRRRDRRR